VQITGKINDITETGRGGGDGKKNWIKYSVVINEEKFGAFDSWTKNHPVGQSGTYEYTEDPKWGKTLQDPKKTSQNNNEVIARLTTIEDLCLNITKMLSQQKTVKIDDGKGGFTTSPVEEIDIEDIPFK